MSDPAETVEVLKKARERVRESWWDGVSLKFPGGDVSVCAEQAIRFVQDSDKPTGLTAAHRAFLAALGAEYVEDIFEFNDSHTHAEIIAKFDEAIAIAEGQVTV